MKAIWDALKSRGVEFTAAVTTTLSTLVLLDLIDMTSEQIAGIGAALGAWLLFIAGRQVQRAVHRNEDLIRQLGASDASSASAGGADRAAWAQPIRSAPPASGSQPGSPTA